VQGDRCDLDATGDQLGDQRMGERARGRGHLGAPGAVPEDGLVGVERVAPVEIAVRDRPAGPRQLGDHVAGDLCAPQPVALAGGGGGAAVGVGLEQGDPESCGHDHVALCRVEHGPRGVGRRADLYGPVGVEALGEVEDYPATPDHVGVELTRLGHRVVDHDQVAGGEVVGQVVELCMSYATRGRHQQAHAVAFEAAPLRGRGGGGVVGEGERGGGPFGEHGHRVAPTGARSAAR
jgi:hypothetical protein